MTEVQQQEEFIPYKHTQLGYTIFLLAGVADFFLILYVAVYGLGKVAIVIFVISLTLMLLFSTLTVEVDEKLLRIRFGPGIFRKRISLKEIQSFQIVRNHWYYGWGIRHIHRGWLYNISGFTVIELHMKNGRRYRIGTDDAENLVKAIQISIKKLTVK